MLAYLLEIIAAFKCSNFYGQLNVYCSLADPGRCKQKLVVKVRSQ